MGAPSGTGTAATAATAERAAAALREQITQGVFPPGTPIRESQVAAELSVSRNTLREGLRLLAAAGLIELNLYRGAVVKTLTVDEIEDIYRVRRMLELAAVAGADGAPPSALEAIGVAVAEAEAKLKKGLWQEAGTASLRFHATLVALAGSRVLDRFFQNLLAQLRLAFSAAGNEPEFHSLWVPRDRVIHDLLVAGRLDKAGAELASYLDDSERWVLELVESPRA
ncbi:MAG: GntR family transcriptional regulator [Actinobacteria bacterium]|nr:GntR family transcriptional regulator [Actinomycetota bacterium]